MEFLMRACFAVSPRADEDDDMDIFLYSSAEDGQLLFQYGGELRPELADGSASAITVDTNETGHARRARVRASRRRSHPGLGALSAVDAADALRAAAAAARGTSGYVTRADLDHVAPATRRDRRDARRGAARTSAGRHSLADEGPEASHDQDNTSSYNDQSSRSSSLLRFGLRHRRRAGHRPSLSDSSSPSLSVSAASPDSAAPSATKCQPKAQSSLSNRQKGRKRVKDDEAQTVCAICLAKIAKRSLRRRLPCSHVYHSDCIVQWLESSARCPVCMQDVLPALDISPAAPVSTTLSTSMLANASSSSTGTIGAQDLQVAQIEVS